MILCWCDSPLGCLDTTPGPDLTSSGRFIRTARRASTTRVFWSRRTTPLSRGDAATTSALRDSMTTAPTTAGDDHGDWGGHRLRLLCSLPGGWQQVVVIGECDNAGGDREFCFCANMAFRGWTRRFAARREPARANSAFRSRPTAAVHASALAPGWQEIVAVGGCRRRRGAFALSALHGSINTAHLTQVLTVGGGRQWANHLRA